MKAFDKTCHNLLKKFKLQLWSIFSLKLRRYDSTAEIFIKTEINHTTLMT